MFLPVGSLDLDILADRVVPRYLTVRDGIWIEALVQEYEHHVGRPRRLLEERISGPLPAHVPMRRAKAVLAVLDRLFRSAVVSPVKPALLRQEVFGRAGQRDETVRSRGDAGWRRNILLQVGRRFGLTLGEVERCLYADVPSERIVTAPQQVVGTEDVMERANLVIAQSLLFRSHALFIEAETGMERLVRTARMLGLLCRVVDCRNDGGAVIPQVPGASMHPFRRGVRLEVSGPLSILGHTTKYGRALARLLPVLGWMPRWTLKARVELFGRRFWFHASHRDGLASSRDRPDVFDSKLEKRFERDFSRLAPDWDLLREPRPVSVEGGLLFPDFALVASHAPDRPVLVELVGFWTRDYLERKMERLRQAGLSNCIVCVDEDLAADKDAWEGAGHVLFFRRRVDAKAVLLVAKRILGLPADRES